MGIVVVAQSLDDRDEALGSVVQSFAFGGLVAVLLVSLVGYGLARAGLRPVEAMRRRAGEIAIDRDTDAALPLPAAHDEIRRLGETLNDMLARLQTAYERERHFVADASHELRTPIAVVKTELESAVRSGDYGTRARGALLAALEACEHLASLADDLLVLARAGEGALPVRPEALPARATLGGVAQRFGDRAGLHGREIRVEAADDVIVRADPLRLAQALGNLVDNALRHGDGDIVLRAAPDAAGVELEVRDAGPGFTPEIAPHAFERFTRDDRARGGSGGGAGLGLAIVRAIAEAHGGSATMARARGASCGCGCPGLNRLRTVSGGRPTVPSPSRPPGRHTNDS